MFLGFQVVYRLLPRLKGFSTLIFKTALRQGSNTDETSQTSSVRTAGAYGYRKNAEKEDLICVLYDTFISTDIRKGVLK